VRHTAAYDCQDLRPVVADTTLVDPILHSPFSPPWLRPACDRESANRSRHDGGSLDWVTARRPVR
jgi:hypothetical protein